VTSAPVSEESMRIGVQPFAPDALAAKRRLARELLRSSGALVAGAVSAGCVSVGHADAAAQALDRLSGLLDHRAGSAPGTIVEPELYDWYYRALDLLTARNFEGLGVQVRRLPLLCVLPLARGGMLEHDPITCFTEPDSPLTISGREPALEWEGANEFEVATSGSALLIGGREVASWREIAGAGLFPIHQHRPLLFQQSGTARREIAHLYQRNLTGIYRDTVPFAVIEPAAFEGDMHEAYERSFAAGLDLLRQTWPELYHEVCALTDSFTLIRGYPFIGGSTVRLFGASFFNLLPEWSALCYADHVLHEAAHQLLHAHFEPRPILLNPAETGGRSPIRPDPRPLEGIFHATFVFLRLSLFFERVMRSDPGFDAETRFHRHLLGLYAGIDQLERFARFTPDGVAFFGQMVDEADRLRSIVPDPDPALYEQIGPDYGKPSSLVSVLME
jgi:HEXXH motif-containing protein